MVLKTTQLASKRAVSSSYHPHECKVYLFTGVVFFIRIWNSKPPINRICWWIVKARIIKAVSRSPPPPPSTFASTRALLSASVGVVRDCHPSSGQKGKKCWKECASLLKNIRSQRAREKVIFRFIAAIKFNKLFIIMLLNNKKLIESF